MNHYAKGFSDGLRPDPSYTISEWADEYRVLPSKGAAEPGRYRTSRTPFLREIMDCLSPQSPVQRVVFIKSSQVGGTELGLCWLGCVIQMYPGPMMIVQPTLELAERFSKQRVGPMIEETPELRDLIAPARQRDSGNSILLKEFKGGVIVMAGSNSGVSLRQMPVRFLFCDEISGYHADADGEGDPVSLAEKRTQTFGDRKKIFLNSTPKVKDTCRIEFEYLKTDQRRYHVPCPHCGEMQHLKWKQLKWDDDDPTTAHYICESNGCVIQEFHKTKMLTGGEWRATAPGNAHVRGYHINALYSPLGWKSWAEIVQEWMEAVDKSKAGDSTLLKAFVNSVLAETWEEEYSAKVGAEGLRARAEMYTPGDVPARALVLTAGVDIQDNRIEVKVDGWTYGEESWVVSYTVIFGDPSRPEIWKQLDNVLFTSYRHELGGELRIAAAAIDTGGHFTHETYQYVREKRSAVHTRVIAVKGQSQKGKPAIGKPTKQDVNFKGQALKWGIDLYPAGVDTVKTTLYGRLKIDTPGPGYAHFHTELSDEFFKQLTSEKQTTRYVKGFPVREWTKSAGQRNEALDCAVYSYVALQYLYTRFNRKTFFEQMEKRLHVAGVPVVTPPSIPIEVTLRQGIPPPTEESTLKPRVSRPMMTKRPGKGFVSGW